MFKGLSRGLFGSTEYPVLIVGNNESGKTTLLYRLKLDKFVTTMPTIGFNCETIEYPRGWHWQMWDVGAGCDRIYPLLRFYLKPETLVLFLHNCADTNEPVTPEWLRHFLWDMVEAKTKYIWIVPTRQEDLEERETYLEGLRQIYEKELSQVRNYVEYKVLQHKVSAKTGEGLEEVMAELHKTMSMNSRVASWRPGKSEIQPKEAPTSEEELRAIIEKEGSEDAMDCKSFWEAFLSADIPAWDHRSHLKAGYIIALESTKNGESIFATADTFIAHLNRLKEAHPDRFRNTQHQTMTIFWLVQLQLAIWNYKIDKGLDQFPAWVDFQDVLLQTPSLRNTKLWSLYYTKGLLFSPQARESWTAPDLQQFPTLKPSPAQAEPGIQIKEDNDDRLLRFAFAIVQHIQASGLRRGAVVKDALTSLETTTIRLRTVDSSIPPYSETQAYFWIQVVHAALQSLASDVEPLNNLSEKSYRMVPVSQLSFSNFMLLFDITPETWKDYYSSKIWESVAARMEFVPPDRKPLPNIIGVSPDAHKKATI
ncbi:P-loop containing nucleoside triphosphate hydrolase protein [Aspergillus pseudodeflectus]|uniref:P-loop containing nucleoside triphosphate hydrolase protein n=1 Tax=Aspergillus pseudodeflectus TaxID=176178 RepID=A0ABR4KVN4_9EURO